ncbi:MULTISPECIES: hypothetical protein [Streptacidiphilus]|uniref:DUF2993 domain-containing protein n=1 Tax=Streptacidiphilus cavernicola TaxID=3342716 RepID=A0ABV6UVF0_9ACTN|nr:hypothetical protein [Streptacidiphilus jeojiense]
MSDPDSTRSDRPTNSEQPVPRRAGARHAAPRLTVRDRMQLPVGRVLAMTAVPTALLMGSIAPKLAFAADASKTTAATSSAQAADTGTTGTQCTQDSSTATPSASSSSSSTASSGTGSSTTKVRSATPTPSASATAKTSTSTEQKATSGTAKNSTASAASPSASASATPSASASPSASATSSGGLLGGLLDGLGNLLSGNHAAAATTSSAASPTATASSAPRAAAVGTNDAATPTATASPSASASASPSSPAASDSASATATPSSTASSPTATPSASASADPSSSAADAANQLCDVSKLAAPVETLPAGTFPVDPWTLKTSRLELINTQFWGVKTVHTAGGDVRVLKFTAQQVNIDNLDMSVPQNGQKLHVQGGSGTTSTMRGGTVTMYVTSLSGTLSKAEGIPLAWLGVSLTLTPDTLPQWLYDLIGSVPIPLTLELNNATAIQAGQTGGNLTIPGMHLYYTPLS